MNEPNSPKYYSARAQVLDAAAKAVMQDRNATYGPPESNFQDIADVWNWFLQDKLGDVRAKQINAIDVAHMMILMKMARLKHNSMHRDSKVDVAGYAACAAECEQKSAVEIKKGVAHYETVRDIIQDQFSKPNPLFEMTQPRNQNPTSL